MIVVGMDIARRADFAAAVHFAWIEGRWWVRRAEQIPHAADYGTLAGYAAHLADSGALVVLDATGVGAPVVEQARDQTDRPVHGVTIHGGRKPRQSGPWDWSLPKRGLVENLRSRLDTGSVVIPRDAPGSGLLTQELAALGRRPRRGRAVAIEARHGHDDVAFAAMIGGWFL